MRLNDLKPNPGAKNDRKRVGHGPSAGQGKTSGRGTKGQSSRTGAGPRLYHQGGNLPFFRRLPFMRGQGFTPPNRVEYDEINLFELNRFPAGSEITPEVLFEAGFIRKSQDSRRPSWRRRDWRSFEGPCAQSQQIGKSQDRSSRWHR